MATIRVEPIRLSPLPETLSFLTSTPTNNGLFDKLDRMVRAGARATTPAEEEITPTRQEPELPFCGTQAEMAFH